MTQYSMTPINNGTRQRTDHNTFADVVASYGRGQIIAGDELWTANADGLEVKKGDMWVHVTHVDSQPVPNGWMAYVHKGYPICGSFKASDNPVEPPPVEEPVTPVFPESFTLTDPSGAQAEYVFVRIVE